MVSVVINASVKLANVKNVSRKKVVTIASANLAKARLVAHNQK